MKRNSRWHGVHMKSMLMGVAFLVLGLVGCADESENESYESRPPVGSTVTALTSLNDDAAASSDGGVSTDMVNLCNDQVRVCCSAYCDPNGCMTWCCGPNGCTATIP